MADLLFILFGFSRLDNDELKQFYLFGQIQTSQTRGQFQGGSPGLVVMGGGSRSKGRGFESRRCILDGHDIFSH